MNNFSEEIYRIRQLMVEVNLFKDNPSQIKIIRDYLDNFIDKNGGDLEVLIGGDHKQVNNFKENLIGRILNGLFCPDCKNINELINKLTYLKKFRPVLGSLYNMEKKGLITSDMKKEFTNDFLYGNFCPNCNSFDEIKSEIRKTNPEVYNKIYDTDISLTPGEIKNLAKTLTRTGDIISNIDQLKSKLTGGVSKGTDTDKDRGFSLDTLIRKRNIVMKLQIENGIIEGITSKDVITFKCNPKKITGIGFSNRWFIGVITNLYKEYGINFNTSTLEPNEVYECFVKEAEGGELKEKITGTPFEGRKPTAKIKVLSIKY